MKSKRAVSAYLFFIACAYAVEMVKLVILVIAVNQFNQFNQFSRTYTCMGKERVGKKKGQGRRHTVDGRRGLQHKSC